MMQHVFYLKFCGFRLAGKEIAKVFSDLQLEHTIELDIEEDPEEETALYVMVNQQYLDALGLDRQLLTVLDFVEGKTLGKGKLGIESISIYINAYYCGVNFSWTFLNPEIIALVAQMDAVIELEFYPARLMEVDRC